MITPITVSQLRIDGKVLFTGDAENMIENLLSFVPANIDVLRCAATETDLANTLEKKMPHTLIICLSETPRNLAQTYSILQNSVRFVDLPVFIVGRDEEYESFKAKIFVKNLTHFKRPIDTDKFTSFIKENVNCYIDTYARPFAEAQAKKAALPKEPAKSEPASPSNTRSALNEEELTKRIEKMQRKEILVVDDDVRMLNVIKLYLQDLYDVTVVPSGKLALKFLSKKKADLVLLDYLMPEMMGPEVLKEIRTNTPLKNVPVIFLTGVSDKELVMRCLEYKPNGYLLKPISREALLERVTEILLGLQ